MDGVKRWRTPNQEWVRWKITHPGGRYHEFYVERVSRRLDAGTVHPSLGERSVENDRNDAAGRVMMDLLEREGLEPHHRVVDYGCGSLRIGRKLIDFLDPGRYIGLDVTDRFFQAGLRTLDPAAVAAKSPELAVIDAAELARRASDPPDFVLSVAVLIHVPRSDLAEYLDRALSLVGERTRGFITFFEGTRHAQLSEMTWSWPGDELVEEVEARGLRADHAPLEGWRLAPGSTREKRVLRVWDGACR